MQDQLYRGKVAIVTGAAQGIGAAVVQALGRQGAIVAALDIQAERLQAAALQYRVEGLAVHAYPVDMRSSSRINEVVGQIEAELGPVAVLVNAAGILHMSAICAMSDEDWENTFAVNTHGPFYLSRAVAQRMIPRRSGAIVTVGSNAAEVPRLQMAAYAASKAAVGHFTKCLGLELAEYGIRCNIVSPGSTDTAMQRQLWQDESDVQKVIAGSLPGYRTGIPLGRIADAEDIAASVLFLLSPGARHITMHNLCVDGGATLGI
ncbi:2,3-dihydro-2,3-dihydroxybenzoate dehydrogenase [Iodobacter sp. HSC-16F04]|uniref:2,3-dihydro-2,3-dihydroxybenzoate dehydrogenase n=1 Tax=Iodobacter violaceini TaxID=3044271 RepID=A0ABX0KQU9_9NEIS|nr:2,3-dihydro-2,3-dihydroxybenzoate dehydrogenase [Iodobacter violacea]NHQ86990.1 2,3-dihydro-2,3-dihydroxybenzoate dehydrogenase [Iodobacter violacea]